MEFRISFTPKPWDSKITHRHRLLLAGSCFTEQIGDKLLAHKFSVLQNPNGILFNPVSVCEAIGNYINNKQISTADLFHLNEAWHSWQHHSRFSSPDREKAAAGINASTANAHAYLKETDYLVITLGSAWTYTLTHLAENPAAQQVAANNHKAPASWFDRKLMRTEECTTMLAAMMEKLLAFNPGIRVAFTISPVRHIREGLVENNRSKAVLVSSVHEIISRFAQVVYFPAYELIIDDLRDYRFFAEDMVHPNYAATNYVWEKFIAAAMDEKTISLMAAINEINAAMHHKPFNPDSEAHRKFKKTILEKIQLLQSQHTYLDFMKEVSFFQ